LPTKIFVQTNDGRYTLLGDGVVPTDESPEPASVVRQLISLQRQHEQDIREQILDALKTLPPHSFEIFAERLLRVYGFEDMQVTRRSRDGGIDGFGSLPVGLTHVNAAFQCKRYTNKPIGREAIDSFRGAAQGIYEQGYFFTTSRFTSEAIAVQRRQGGIPIALFDGAKIVEIMLARGFGVEFRELRIAELALDTILEQD
jgi:restriction system protein